MIDKVRIPRKAWTLIHLTLIVWIAFIVSGIISRQIAGYIEETYSQGIGAAPAAVRAPLFKSSRNYFPIIRYNIFDSSKAGKVTEDSLGGPSAIGAAELAGAPKTSLNLTLIGTVFDDSGLSRLAVIQSGSSDQELYKVNDSVHGATIVNVERNRVSLLNEGRLEVLEVDYSKSLSSKSGSASSRISGGKDVVKASESDYLISRRYVDSQLKNMSKLLTQVRAIPNVDKSGVTNGFKLFAIRKGSMFNKIGLKNHDVVQRINGIELNSAEKALELFQAFRNESNFEVDLLRKKQKTTLRFSIQ